MTFVWSLSHFIRDLKQWKINLNLGKKNEVDNFLLEKTAASTFLIIFSLSRSEEEDWWEQKLKTTHDFYNKLNDKFLLQVNEIVPEEKCSLIPKQMCHSVTEENLSRRARRSARRSAQAESPLAFLRRHYLSRRQQNRQMLPRRSRNFLETTTTTEKPKMRQICKMVPEQECEKKRVNPRVVEKQMMKKFCRQPRKSSYVDQLLVARLKGGLKWVCHSREKIQFQNAIFTGK